MRGTYQYLGWGDLAGYTVQQELPILLVVAMVSSLPPLSSSGSWRRDKRIAVRPQRLELALRIEVSVNINASSRLWKPLAWQGRQRESWPL